MAWPCARPRRCMHRSSCCWPSPRCVLGLGVWGGRREEGGQGGNVHQCGWTAAAAAAIQIAMPEPTGACAEAVTLQHVVTVWPWAHRHHTVIWINTSLYDIQAGSHPVVTWFLCMLPCLSRGITASWALSLLPCAHQGPATECIFHCLAHPLMLTAPCC